MSLGWLKRYINGLRDEQETVRAIQKDVAGKLEALPESERDPSQGLSSQALGLINQWKHANGRLQELTQSETRALDSFPSKDDAKPQQIAVMLETQASLAQHQIGEGLVKRSPEEANTAVREAVERRGIASAKATMLLPDVDAALGRLDNLGYDSASQARRELVADPHWQTAWDIPGGEAGVIGEWVEAMHEYRRADEDANTSAHESNRASDQRAMGALGTDQKAALTLNAARFLIDSAERGYERIAWSDGANRIENANLARNGGSPLAATKWYDEITPAAMTRLLQGLGFKPDIEHIAIRGHGHWSIELTPEMRRVIRKTGLPILGLLALVGNPDKADAQGPDGNPYADAARSGGSRLAEWLGGGALATAVVAGAVMYARARGKRMSMLAAPAQAALLAAGQAMGSGAVQSAERASRTGARPDFLFPRREPTGTEYDAPLDVSQTPSGKGAALFNIKKLGLSQSGTQIFSDVVDQLDLKKRHVTFGETSEEAARRAVDPHGLLQEKPWTGTDALAARIFQKQAVDRLETLAAQAKSPALTAEERTKIADEMGSITADIGEMGTRISREREQAGRTLSAYRIVANSTLDEATWSMLAVRAKQLALTTDEQLNLRKLINDKDRLGLTQFVSSLHKSSLVDKALSFWKTNLLGISTVLKVGTSHAIEQADQIVQQPIVAGVDALAALVRGTQREHAGLGPRMGARIKGLVRGWNEGVAMLKSGSGITPEQAGRWDIHEVHYDNPIIQGWVNLVHGVHNLAYRPFYAAALEASLDETADVYADRAVKADPSLNRDQVRAQLRANPNNEMALRAVDRAERTVYQNKGTLAELGAAVQRKAREKGTVPQIAATVTMPFVKIPANIAMRAIDGSPLGLATAALRASPWVKGAAGVSKQARFSEDVARAFTGTAGLAALGYGLAASGHATGDYPTTPGDKNLWEAEGKQAHSVKLNGRWWNVSDFGPQGMSLALGAQLHDMIAENPNNASAVAAGMAFAVGKTVADEPFLKGISSGLAALNDPVRQGETYARSQVGSVVPSMVGRTAKAIDPTRREVNSVTDQVESRIPFLSKRLPAKLDAFGRPETDTDLGRSLAVPSPVRSTKDAGDPVLQELDRLNVGLPGAQSAKFDTGKRVTTTPDERREESAFLGPIKYRAVEAVTTSPRYSALDDESRRDLLKRALEVPLAAMHTVDRLAGGGGLDDVARARLVEKMVDIQVAQLSAEAAAGLPALRRAARRPPARTAPPTP